MNPRLPVICLIELLSVVRRGISEKPVSLSSKQEERRTERSEARKVVKRLSALGEGLDTLEGRRGSRDLVVILGVDAVVAHDLFRLSRSIEREKGEDRVELERVGEGFEEERAEVPARSTRGRRNGRLAPARERRGVKVVREEAVLFYFQSQCPAEASETDQTHAAHEAHGVI